MRGVLVLVVLVLVGLSVWLMGSGGSAPTETPTAKSANATAASPASAAPAAANPEAPPLQRQEATVLPAGPTINLRVVTFGSNAPVAGATVRFRLPTFEATQLTASQRQELSDLRRDREQYLLHHGGEVQTDAQGMCRVPLNPPWGTPVCARAGELYGEFHLTHDAAQEQVLVMRPDRTLRVAVLDAAGQPAAGILVRATRDTPEANAKAAPQRGWQLGETDATGKLEGMHCQDLADFGPTRVLQLTALPPGATSLPVPVEITAPPPEVVLHLPAAGTVTVHVRDAAGQPIDPTFLATPEVSMAVFDRRPANAQEEREGRLRYPFRARIDERGDARLANVAFDRFLLLSRGQFGDGLSIEGPTRASPDIDAVLQEASGDVIVTGMLQAPDGSRLSTRVFSLSCTNNNSFTSRSERTNATGKLRCNLGRNAIGNDVVFAFQTEPAGSQPALTLELPSRLVVNGLVDLGLLRLQPLGLTLAGRLVHDGDPTLSQVQFQIERRQGPAWTQAHDLRPAWKPDGTFTVRSGTAAGTPLRLVVQEGSFLPVAPIECRAGDAKVDIHLTVGGSATASFLIDDNVPADRLQIRFERIEPKPSPDPLARWRDGFDWRNQQAQDGRLQRSWSGLLPGTYRLTAQGLGIDEPIAVVDTVIVPSGPCTDPRLRDIDLRRRVRTIEIRATDAAGVAIVDRNAFVVVRSSSLQWFGFQLGNGKVTLAAPNAVDLFVIAPGCIIAKVDGVTESRTIPLQAATETKLSLALPAPLPEGVLLRLNLHPQLGVPTAASIALDNGNGLRIEDFFVGHVDVDAEGDATVPVRWPGLHQLDACVGRSARGGECYLYDLEPRTVTLPAAPGTVVRIGQKGLDAALQRLQKR